MWARKGKPHREAQASRMRPFQPFRLKGGLHAHGGAASPMGVRFPRRGGAVNLKLYEVIRGLGQTTNTFCDPVKGLGRDVKPL